MLRVNLHDTVIKIDFQVYFSIHQVYRHRKFTMGKEFRMKAGISASRPVEMYDMRIRVIPKVCMFFFTRCKADGELSQYSWLKEDMHFPCLSTLIEFHLTS